MPQELKQTKLDYDEGPGKEGDCGPYYQSMRRDIYKKYALELIEKGAEIFFEHSASNLGDTDLLVYSNAVSMENPEIVEAKRRGIPCVARAEALGALMADYNTSIAISGTHGKTTTTSMISFVIAV